LRCNRAAHGKKGGECKSGAKGDLHGLASGGLSEPEAAVQH
jgi:hypothetical protein